MNSRERRETVLFILRVIALMLTIAAAISCTIMV